MSDDEILLVASKLSQRDELLFLLGIRTGLRLKELLSLTIHDVYQNGRVLTKLRVNQSKNGGYRNIALHPSLYNKIENQVHYLRIQGGFWLFQGMSQSALSPSQAWNVLKRAYELLRLDGKVATHSMRKTFAGKMYRKLGYDLVRTQQALGHKSITSTIRYLPVNQEEIDKAVLED